MRTAVGPPAPSPPTRFGTPASYTPKHLAEKILASKAALEGERKQVTVLFADLKGSMELLADRDPEEARKILDPVLEQMMEAVHRYEGTVNQVMGDGIMALFGAPLAHEDHAVRACYAALRMQEAIRRYTEDVRRAHGVEVQIRVGLNSGEVVVRSVGSDLRMDYTAVGQTTHLAARMEQLATPGTIRLTGETLALAEGYVEVIPLGPVPVKGLADAVEVYEVTGAGSARTRLQVAARRGLTRFVGRDADLDQLRRAQQLSGSGHGQVAAVVGEAGVGKSRLIYEFTHSHRLQGWLVLESASVSYGKATSYLPVIDLLKGYFKIQDRDDLREIREKVTGKLLTLDRALEPTLPALLALLDVPMDDASWQTFEPAQRRQQTLNAVRRLLLREARAQPLLLIFEDLHWIDGETQAVLDGLVDSLGSARLLLLVSYRPEYQHAWGGKTSYSQMRLDALPAESAGEMLDALLGHDPRLAPVKQLLVKRGNPFFLEETLRTLVETKALAGERGRYRLTRPVQAIQVPPTVQVMLAARIDRLAPEDKRLLQVASVVGKDVPRVLLQAVGDVPEEALCGGLDHLQSAEFLYETGLFLDLEYSFTHALTHDVAYGSLLQERRRELHARIAEAVERLYPERLAEHVERLAHHSVRGERWDHAVNYLRQAAARAAARAANREAVTHLEQAVAALGHQAEARATLEEAIDVRLDLRNALLALGEMTLILETLQEAERLAERLGDRARLGKVRLQIFNHHFFLGEHERAIEIGEPTVEIARALGDRALEIIACIHLSEAYLAIGDYQRTIDLVSPRVAMLTDERAREWLGEPVLPAVLSRSLLATALAELGRLGEALRIAQEGVNIAEAADHPFTKSLAYCYLGEVRLRKGDLTEAIRRLTQALDLARAADLPFMVPHVAGPLATACALTGRTAEAVELAAEAVELSASLKRASWHAILVARLADTHLAAGRVRRAREVVIDALEQARRRKERGDEATILTVVGKIESDADRGDPGMAQSAYREALSIAHELGMRPLVAHCHLGLGKLYRRIGTREQAQNHLTTATTMYREMDMRFWLEQAEAEMRVFG